MTVLWVVGLRDPDRAVVGLLTKQTLLLECLGNAQRHVTPREDACNLLEDFAQERVTSSGGRGKRNSVPDHIILFV